MPTGQTFPQLRHWLSASRPKTLLAGAVPVMVGAWLALRLDKVLPLPLLVLTLGSCLALQVATNFFNDAIDADKGADTAGRLGPTRLTASGLIPPVLMQRAAVLLLAIAVLLALPLWWQRGWPVVAIGLPSLWFCYGYTGGPWPLAYRGLGELFVVLFFGLVAVAGSQFVLAGQWSAAALLAGTQIGLLSAVLIAINNLRDVDEDRASGKRTLVARFGPRFGRTLIFALVLSPFAIGAGWPALGHPLAGALPLLVMPLSLRILLGIARHPPSAYHNRLLGLSALNLLLFGALWAIGLAVTT